MCIVWALFTIVCSNCSFRHCLQLFTIVCKRLDQHSRLDSANIYPILSHFAKRTIFWLLTGSNGPRDVWACFHPLTIALWGLIELVWAPVGVGLAGSGAMTRTAPDFVSTHTIAHTNPTGRAVIGIAASSIGNQYYTALHIMMLIRITV